MPDDIRELRHPDFYGLQLAEQPVTQGARLARNVDTWKYGLLNKRPGLRRMNHRQYTGQIVGIADIQRICDYGKFLILSGFAAGGEVYEHQQTWADPCPPSGSGGPDGGGGGGGTGGGANPEPPFNENWPPVAAASVDEPVICLGVTVNFTGDASWDPDGEIVSYFWDFGDGNTSLLANPSHTYAADGLYNVTLTVTDNEGVSTTSEPFTVGVLAFAVGDSVQDALLLDNAYDVAISGEFAYVVNIGNGRLAKIRIADMTITGNCVLTAGAGARHVVTDGTHAYVSSNGADAVDKVRLSDMALVATVANPVTLQSAAGIAVAGGFAYVACTLPGNRVTKIRTADMVIVGNQQDNVNLFTAWAICISGDSAYVGCWALGTARLTRVRLSDLAVLGSVQDLVHLDQIYHVCADDSFAYCATSNHVTKVSIPALVVTDWDANGAFGGAFGIALSADTGYLYITYGGTDRVGRMLASDMTPLEDVVDAVFLDSAYKIAHSEGVVCVTTRNPTDRCTRMDCAL